MPLVQLRQDWPGHFRRTIHLAGVAKVLTFAPGEAQVVEDVELLGLEADMPSPLRLVRTELKDEQRPEKVRFVRLDKRECQRVFNELKALHSGAEIGEQVPAIGPDEGESLEPISEPAAEQIAPQQPVPAAKPQPQQKPRRGR